VVLLRAGPLIFFWSATNRVGIVYHTSERI
jgi:hypothetical protein